MTTNTQLIHRPPLPLIPLPMAGPRGPLGYWPLSLLSASVYCCSLLGFLIVWSTERIVQAASVAALITLMRTSSGSHTNCLYMLAMRLLITSTPNQVPSSASWECFYLSLLRTSVESIPELSASCLGITSKALAKALITSCCLPWIYLRYSLRKRESSISIAPPPATTDWALIARLTIMMASLSERSASSMYWSAPPLRMIVQDLVPGQPVKMLYLSAPT